MLKMLHFTLLAVGHYWWFLRKKARSYSLWFRERLSLQWRTQRRNRFRRGGIRQQCGGSGRHWEEEVTLYRERELGGTLGKA